MSLPESANALVAGLSDGDPLVRSACLRSLARSGAAPALLDIAASLKDPEPEVRSDAVSAVSALAPYQLGLTTYLSPLLNDERAQVSTRAAVSLLRVNREHDKAKKHLRQLVVLGDFDARAQAIESLGDWGDVEAFEFLTNELKDPTLAPIMRRNILGSMTRIDASKSMPYLIASLGLKEPLILESSAGLLGSIGAPALESVIAALQDGQKAEGALLALEHLPLPPAEPILAFARESVTQAGEYDLLKRGVKSADRNEAMALLAKALQDQSDEHGVRALRALGLLGDRDAMQTAIENLQTSDASQRANVLEALESISAKWRSILQPLLHIWEGDHLVLAKMDWERMLNDPDEWVRECAVFAKSYGETHMETIATLSLMDRILLLKRVPLFVELSPAELKQLASIAMEEFFPDGEVIAYKGEQGDAMFVIASGEVRVRNEVDGKEIELARRKPGEYVGELSIVNREPRNATLIAVGDVRVLSIDQKTFEGLLRARPEASLFIIHVLSKRLKEVMEKNASLSRENTG